MYEKEIRREINRYTDSVRLFYSIKEFLKERSLHVDVEPTIKTITNKKRPDIVIYDTETSEIKVIMDYKWSLKRKEEYIVEDLNDVYTKYYSPITDEGTCLTPDVIALIPSEDVKNIGNENVMKKIHKKLIILSVKIDIEEGVIIFSIVRGDPHYKKFINMLREANYQIPFNKHILTRYSFIREEPPIPYTVFIIWKTIYHIASVNELYNVKKAELDYEIIRKDLEEVFPPWVKEDIRQLTEGRLNKALKFLKKLDFIKRKDEKIIVNLSKGSRTKDQLDYFIEKYLEMEEKIAKPPSQKTLFDFV